MSTTSCTRICPCALLASARTHVLGVFQWLTATLPHRHRIPVEIVIVDAARRKTIRRELAWALRHLQSLMGDPVPADVGVLVQQVIPGQSEVAGCYHVGTRSDGGHFALIRLALQVRGKRLSSDELLAALAEQYIGLTCHGGKGSSVTVPIQLEPAGSGQPDSTLPPDPLAAAAARYHSEAA